MSGIFGIYNLDGQPVDAALLERMSGAIAHRGPDGVGHWIDGSVGLGHRMLHTTPESIYEEQPLSDEGGDLCLTMDGRLDNREELLSALKSAGAKPRGDTDAELVLKAYGCWGTACPIRILGDFAFAIWDKRNRQLFCARDAVGNKPFTYHCNGRRFVWASELHQILEDPTVSAEPNEGMVGEHLAVRITHTEETLYKGILRLPPAHWLLVRHGRLTKQRYWDIDPGKQIRYRSDDEYAEHFRDVFQEAVRCCLRSHTRVGSQLSGGLDSSSVVCMTQTLYQRGLAMDRGFETFSMRFPGLPCDEGDYIRAVVDRWNLSANQLCLQDPPAGWLEQQVNLYKDLCDTPNGTLVDPLKALAREKGFRVVLTGLGGDERLTGSLYYFSDLAQKGKLLSLLREMREQDVTLAGGRGLYKLLRYILEPRLPNSTLRIIKAVKRRALRRWRPSLTWIDPGFSRRVDLAERLQRGVSPGARLDFCQRLLYTVLTNGGQLYGTEIEDRSAAWFGIEERHPFKDRRMVELSFALPENQRRRKHQKFVLRQAMRGYVPELVRRRSNRAEFSDVLVKAVEKMGGERFFEKLRLDELGWIDGTRVRIMYREMKSLHESRSDDYLSYIWPLWTVCALELWYKSLFSGKGILQSEYRTNLEAAAAQG